MKEKLLHYVWQYKLFNQLNLVTENKEKVFIVHSGVQNNNTGPDFLNTKIEIGGQLWFGNVEIHLKSSDWYAHNHEKDTNYDAVILHVVYENDVEVFMKNNKAIPTLELKGKINKEILENYKNLFSNDIRWIPCEKQIASIDSFFMNNWLERLFYERLEIKSEFIKELLLQSNNDFEAVLFQLLAKNFGLKINGDAFLKLATSFEYSVLRKNQHKEKELTSLLFGQAGFLEEEVTEKYYQELKEIYNYLKHKYHLKNNDKNNFQFFRMRPSNFPTIRLAQLSALYVHHKNLFSKLITLNNISDFYSLFSVKVNDFWNNHYTFEKTSKKSAKQITKSFIDLLVINTIIPLKFVYLKSIDRLDEEKLLELIKQIKPEKNSTITKFKEAKITVKNAFETQALLQLKNDYCMLKKCLDCKIGNRLLRK